MSDILSEVIYDDVRLTDEEAREGRPKRLKLEAIVQHADVPNGNKRVYSRALLERELKNFNKMIEQGAAFGAIDHPADGVSRVSDAGLLWESVELGADGKVRGKAVVLGTAKGRDLEAIAAAGGQIGISSRGRGTTRPENYKGEQVEMVNDDYKLTTFDAVIGQSVHGAVVTQSVYERKEVGVDLKGLTLEQLENERPDLVTAIGEKFAEPLSAGLEEQLGDVLDQYADEIIEAIEEEYAEQLDEALTAASHEGRVLPEAVVATILDTLMEAGYLDGDEIADGEDEGVSDEVAEHIQALYNKIEELGGSIEETKQLAAETGAHVLSEELLNFVADKIDEANRGEYKQELMEYICEHAEDEESATQLLTQELERISKLEEKAARRSIPQGSGRALQTLLSEAVGVGGGDGSGALTEAQQRMRLRAGLNS